MQSSGARISFFFHRSPKLELGSIEYYPPKADVPLRSVRGKSPGAYESSGSFQWTSAVRALALIAGRACLGLEAPHLSSKASSLAKSLHYALDRQPAWLLDVFGIDSKGRSQARRLIRRTMKSSGRAHSVDLSLNLQYLPRENIFFFVDDVPCIEKLAIEQLIHQIELSSSDDKHLPGVSRNRASARIQSATGDPVGDLDFCRQTTSVALQNNQSDSWPFSNPLEKAKLANLIFNEVLSAMYETNVFSRRAVSESLTKIQRSSYFNSLVGDSSSAFQAIEWHTTRINLNRQTLSDSMNGFQPIRIGIPVTLVSSIILFKYLRDVMQLPIEIDYSPSHSCELLQKMEFNEEGESFHGIVLSLTNAARLIGDSTKLPLTPYLQMPSSSCMIATPSSRDYISENEVSKGEYLMISDMPSTQQHYYASLCEAGEISRGKTVITCLEPFEVSRMFSEMKATKHELRAILGFPHTEFQRLYNEARLIRPKVQTSHEIFLCYTDSFGANHEQAELLSTALYEGWLALLADPQRLDKICRDLVSDCNFLSSISRSSGLHYLVAREYMDNRQSKNFDFEQH